MAFTVIDWLEAANLHSKVRPIPPSHPNRIVIRITLKIEVETVGSVIGCRWQLQVGASGGDITEGAFDDAIADYGSCDSIAIPPGI